MSTTVNRAASTQRRSAGGQARAVICCRGRRGDIPAVYPHRRRRHSQVWRHVCRLVAIQCCYFLRCHRLGTIRSICRGALLDIAARIYCSTTDSTCPVRYISSLARSLAQRYFTSTGSRSLAGHRSPHEPTTNEPTTTSVVSAVSHVIRHVPQRPSTPH